MSNSQVVRLQLKPGRKHKVLRGHPWVFSNQLREIPEELAPGSEVLVMDSDGEAVGRGYGHPGTLISARIYERNPEIALDQEWLVQRLKRALELRQAACSGRSSFRWVHGDADGLPGLIIDRYQGADEAPRVVMSANTAGMDSWRDRIADVLQEHFGVAAGLWKCDARGRELEGLASEVSLGWGPSDAGAEGLWCSDDDGVSVHFDAWKGQKTGLFLDMWENRRRMAAALAGGKMLDLYSYVGQWGMAAARAGAEQVVCVDRSQLAIDLVEKNAQINGFGELITGECSSVDEFLRSVPDRSYDAVVCDPPSFIRNKKHVSAGLRAYRTLFAHALRKVRTGGFAVLASCSHHLFEDRFSRVVEEAARWGDVRLSVVMRGEQSPCHPVPQAFPEARYLKCWLVQVQR